MNAIWKMPASGKTVRGLLVGVALVLTLAWGCGSSSETETEEQDPVTTAMGAANEVADLQGRAIDRAWAMAQVATAWAALDPEGAQQAIADAIAAAEEAAAGGDEQRSAAKELREQAAGWDPVDWRSAIALAERIERNASRAWVLRALAGELAEIDPEQASALLKTALEIAGTNPLPQYRSVDESTVALEFVALDPEAALQAAAGITDPAAKAGALREMAGLLADTDAELAETALADAIRAADEIGDAYDRAWALRESAVAAGTDAGRTEELLGRAEEAAGQIEGIEPKAFALSDIAVAWATVDPDKATELVESIAANYPEARVAALVGIAEQIRASDPERAAEALESALEENEEVLDTYEQARAENVIAIAMATVDPERAKEIAGDIEDPYLQGEALRSIAVASAAEDPDAAVSLAETIHPRSIRVQTLIAIGAEVAAADEDKAIEIFEAALSEAGELKDTYPLRLLTSAWAALNPTKALEVADRVENDGDRVAALTSVALAMLATEEAKAQVIYETARETAQAIKSDDDPFAAVTALKALAAAWSSVDEAEAGRLYDAAFEAAAAVEVEPTG